MKFITIIGGVFLWGCVGGFDWIYDSIDCMNSLADLNMFKELKTISESIPIVNENIPIVNENISIVNENIPILTRAEVIEYIKTADIYGNIEVDEDIYYANIDLFERVEEEINMGLLLIEEDSLSY